MKITDLEIYKQLEVVGHLSEKGLKYYIALLRGDIQDHTMRIQEVVRKKGLHKELLTEQEKGHK